MNSKLGNPWENGFRDMLASVIEIYNIQLIFEEWNDNRGTAMASTLATHQVRRVGWIQRL
jgi:hypothetical protein